MITYERGCSPDVTEGGLLVLSGSVTDDLIMEGHHRRYGRMSLSMVSRSFQELRDVNPELFNVI